MFRVWGLGFIGFRVCVSGLGCAMRVLQGIDCGCVGVRFRAEGLKHYPNNVNG